MTLLDHKMLICLALHTISAPASDKTACAAGRPNLALGASDHLAIS